MAANGDLANGEPELKEMTYAEVSKYSTKKDIRLVIHDRIYNPSVFIDEHPGGEEVMLDVAGTDATESFEDVGHSDEAREILATLMVGKLKRVEGDPPPPSAQPDTSSGGSGDAASFGITTYLLILLVVGGAYYAMQVMNADKKQ